MNNIIYALLTLTLAGCVSDFSPEPRKGNQNVDPTAYPDAGKDAARADASGNPAETDSGTVNKTPCDLTGRWILTERSVSTAIGAKQITRAWHYLELAQQGDDVTMTKTLFCGNLIDSPPTEIIVVHVDDMPSWPGYVTHPSYNGRKGSSRVNGGGCDVTFEERALMRGLTVAAYQDRNSPMPTKAQQAMGSTPGWEDWDMDGNPGITQAVGSLGTLYSAIRSFSTYTGSIAQGATSFQLDYEWDQKRVVLGTKDPDPTGLLSSDSQRDNTPGGNFVQFARLGASQATGSDDAICDAIRTLAVALTPAAAAAP